MNDVVTAKAAASGNAAARSVPSGAEGHLELTVSGLTCPHCPQTLERALAALAGVAGARVNLASARASIDYDPSQIKVADILSAIRSAGFAAGLPRGATDADGVWRQLARVPTPRAHVLPEPRPLAATPRAVADRVLSTRSHGVFRASNRLTHQPGVTP